MSQIDKVFGFESELKLSVLYSYTRRFIFAFVSGLKYSKRWHPNLYLLVSYLNPSLGTASEVGHASRWFDFHSQSQEHEHLHVAPQATRCRGPTPWNLLSWRYRWHGQATRPAAPTRGRRPPPAFRPSGLVPRTALGAYHLTTHRYQRLKGQGSPLQLHRASLFFLLLNVLLPPYLFTCR